MTASKAPTLTRLQRERREQDRLVRERLASETKSRHHWYAVVEAIEKALTDRSDVTMADVLAGHYR